MGALSTTRARARAGRPARLVRPPILDRPHHSTGQQTPQAARLVRPPQVGGRPFRTARAPRASPRRTAVELLAKKVQAILQLLELRILHCARQQGPCEPRLRGTDETQGTLQATGGRGEGRRQAMTEQRQPRALHHRTAFPTESESPAPAGLRGCRDALLRRRRSAESPAWTPWSPPPPSPRPTAECQGGSWGGAPRRVPPQRGPRILV